MNKRPLPAFLRLWFQSALIGEIYPGIRAIAVGFSESRGLTSRFYFDHEPTEHDRENMSCVLTEVFANTSRHDEIAASIEEFVFSDLPLNMLEPLDGFVYARREYDLVAA